VVGALDHQRSCLAEGLIAMTHPRAAEGRFIRRTTPAPLPPHADPSRRAAGQLAAAATRLRQPLNGGPTSILIAAIDDLPVVMRMTVSDADDPAAAKRVRRPRNSARRHRRRALGDCSEDHPDGLAILAWGRLLRPAPAPVEQGAGRRHTGRRRGGLGAADACQRADG
jgi:hypothetical protein